MAISQHYPMIGMMGTGLGMRTGGPQPPTRTTPGLRTGGPLPPSGGPNMGIPGLRTGGPLPPTEMPGRRLGLPGGEEPPGRIKPPALPGAERVLRPPPGMMGHQGSMRMATPQPPQLAPGQAMTRPKTDPAGFLAEAPNKVGRPAALRT